jgi:hypothetical protein
MHSEPRAAKVDSRDLKISKVLNVKNLWNETVSVKD